jgi:uncharacterized membrane protein
MEDQKILIDHQPFGDSFFGRCAEIFARFFGTPTFIIGQTLFVAVWIVYNIYISAPFDPYPFILLNLAFSTQAAYAAPLILLAQTRQAERDKEWERSDAAHREELHLMVIQQQKHATDTAEQILELTKKLDAAIQEIHLHIVKDN